MSYNGLLNRPANLQRGVILKLFFDDWWHNIVISVWNLSSILFIRDCISSILSMTLSICVLSILQTSEQSLVLHSIIDLRRLLPILALLPLSMPLLLVLGEPAKVSVSTHEEPSSFIKASREANALRMSALSPLAVPVSPRFVWAANRARHHLFPKKPRP